MTSLTPSSVSLSPVQPGERIDSLDVARGYLSMLMLICKSGILAGFRRILGLVGQMAMTQSDLLEISENQKRDRISKNILIR